MSDEQVLTPDQQAKQDEAVSLFDAAAKATGEERTMWLNAMSLIHPSDEMMRKVGEDVVAMVQQSMRRKRTNPVEPIGLVTLRISAS